MARRIRKSLSINPTCEQNRVGKWKHDKGDRFTFSMWLRMATNGTHYDRSTIQQRQARDK